MEVNNIINIVEQRERLWSNALFVLITTGPVFMVGFTLGFPSAVLLNLEFSSIQSDLFGVSA